jgi:lipopolysaccharide export system permease protein
MKILQRYIIRQALATLLITLSVFTFVLLLGGVLRQLSDLLVNRQIGLGAVGLFFLMTMPYMLGFSMPMAMLATALLVFGRLSADNELNAMRASGVSVGFAVAPVILLATLMSGLCLYLNTTLTPRCQFGFKTLFLRMGVENPTALLEEGTYMRTFPGYVIYIGRKKLNVLDSVTLYTLDNNGKVVSSLRARKGIVTARAETRMLLLDLYDVRGDLRDPQDPGNIKKIRVGTTARRYPVELDLGRALRQAQQKKKLGDMDSGELLAEIRSLTAQGVYPAAALLVAHQRVAMAVACVAFTLVGIPLGLKTSRRETSVGIAISLGLASVFYLFMVAANALKERPQFYPEAILWIPILGFELLGLWLLWRVTRV